MDYYTPSQRLGPGFGGAPPVFHQMTPQSPPTYIQRRRLQECVQNPAATWRRTDKFGSKEGKGDGSGNFSSQSAMLLPNLWDKTLPFDGSDFKLEFMDLDEFLNENYVGKEDSMSASLGSMEAPSPQVPAPASPMHQVLNKPPLSASQSPQPNSPVNGSPGPGQSNVDVDYSLTPSDIALSTVPGEETFDPRRRAFSEDELRPQPMIKKSKKVFVPEGEKDDRYWARRKKNNLAAKRSRDARRIKENQIALRAAFLEKENETLRKELQKTIKENKALTQQVAEYKAKEGKDV